MIQTLEQPKAAISKDWKSRAWNIWPQAEWIAGSGPFAVVAQCRHVTVSLHPNKHAAELAMDTIDMLGCGGGCARRHSLVGLE